MPAVVLIEGRDAHQPMHAMLGSHQPVCTRPANDEGHALEPRLFTRRLVDDLDLESMTLRPLQVHAHEHLDPVLRLHPTLADRDRDHGVVVRVRVGEEQVELARSQLTGQLRLFLLDLLRKLRVTGGELVEFDEVASALLELLPGSYQLAVLGRLSPEGARISRVVPDT